MISSDPSPTIAARRSPLSRKGRGLDRNAAPPQPSPLAGEGARRAEEGSAGRTLWLAKKLRKNMTDVEKKLWQNLRAKRFESFKFRRQVPIGNYIVDFVCFEKKLIIELDGSQHEGSTHDAKRDAWLRAEGFTILRFWNNDINAALDGTLLAILEKLK
ncbi:MAG: endonuclease domain-containing protein [Alphaproteobacteria bacterium]|nr:endonuclease domain-containing protein [Alphaproteobacteria bacterium]